MNSVLASNRLCCVRKRKKVAVRCDEVSDARLLGRSLLRIEARRIDADDVLVFAERVEDFSDGAANGNDARGIFCRCRLSVGSRYDQQ